MSDRPQEWDRSRDEIISGEYVLGVLSEEDRRRVEARIATDAKFAMQVQRWQTNLADFNDEYQDMRPPQSAYARIEKRLFGGPEFVTAGLWQSLWGSVAVWRGLTAAALLLAVGVGLAGRIPLPWTTSSSSPLVAELTGMDSPISLVATYDFASGRLSVTPAALRQETPKSLELWLIEDGKPAPLSLGVLPEDGNGDILINANLRDAFAAGKTIAITVEPLGGSPDGKPTGPVIALGKTRLL
jgi:anti-sigma-K factor RskA